MGVSVSVGLSVAVGASVGVGEGVSVAGSSVIGVAVAMLGWRFFDLNRLLQRPRIEVH